jgi:MFS transporter, ACS family, D-galactonate transporter
VPEVLRAFDPRAGQVPSMLVNFADKIVVGLARVPIMTELELTPKQFGFLGSTFFFLFSTSAVIFGFIINPVATRWVLLGLALVWRWRSFPCSAAPVSSHSSSAASFSVPMSVRYSRLPAPFKWFPDAQRSLPTPSFPRARRSAQVAAPALNWVVVNHSWHWAFAALGILGTGAAPG